MLREGIGNEGKMSSGAIAFRQPTKIWPSRLMALACGKMRASRAPVIIPIEIRLIRLARFQAERIR